MQDKLSQNFDVTQSYVALQNQVHKNPVYWFCYMYETAGCKNALLLLESLTAYMYKSSINWPDVIKTVFMLEPTEHVIDHAHKC